MYPSEIMTILILFHLSHYRHFKAFYLEFLWEYHHQDFPTLLSYTRFVSVAPSVLAPLCSYLTQLKGKPQVLLHSNVSKENPHCDAVVHWLLLFCSRKIGHFYEGHFIFHGC
ncbi:hypothetical protein SAMN05421784_10360 [Xenorhabdus koppenhoeferi]|uniref:Transposase n=1 Tax=Xenorhabdus koppenhoeferi TaxID=351659 RepID=A0A1I7F8E5_9GAMM|nr:hypothetical protein SAMN05421784_10360 [Xenorhabdus koppenhoeferi]